VRMAVIVRCAAQDVIRFAVESHVSGPATLEMKQTVQVDRIEIEFEV